MAPQAPGGFSDPLARRRGGDPTGKEVSPKPGFRPGLPRGPAGPATIFIFQALKPEIFILFFNPSKYS